MAIMINSGVPIFFNMSNRLCHLPLDAFQLLFNFNNLLGGSAQAAGQVDDSFGAEEGDDDDGDKK